MSAINEKARNKMLIILLGILWEAFIIAISLNFLILYLLREFGYIEIIITKI